MNNILSLKLIVTYVIKKTATTFEEAILRARYEQYLIPRINSNICDKKTATTFEEAIQRARYKQYLIPRINSNMCDKKIKK